MEYLIIKEITPTAILAAGDHGSCFQKEFGEFMRYWESVAGWFGHLTPKGNEELIEEICKHSQWPSWLTNHGFIDVIEEKRFSVGKRILVGSDSYTLRCHSITNKYNYHAGLFSDRFKGDWTGIMAEVSNRDNITSQDIDKMLQGRNWKPAEG